MAESKGIVGSSRGGALRSTDGVARGVEGDVILSGDGEGAAVLGGEERAAIWDVAAGALGDGRTFIVTAAAVAARTPTKLITVAVRIRVGSIDPSLHEAVVE